MNFFRCAAAICFKDLLSEWRERRHANTLFFFSLLTVFLFSFALGNNPDLLGRASPGLMWMVVLFSAVLVLDRSFQAEIESGCLEGLRLVAISPQAIFLGKWISNFLFILAVQGSVALAMAILFGLSPPKDWDLWISGCLLGDVGIATLGTFYAALATQVKARQVLLPMLLFPMLIPLLLGAVHLLQYAWEGDLFSQSLLWLRLMILFDLVFVTACFVAIGPLLEG